MLHPELMECVAYQSSLSNSEIADIIPQVSDRACKLQEYQVGYHLFNELVPYCLSSILSIEDLD